MASMTCRIRGAWVSISGPIYTWYLPVAFTNTTRPRATVVGHSSEGADNSPEVVPVRAMLTGIDDHLVQLPGLGDWRDVEPELTRDHVEDPELRRAALPRALDRLPALMEMALIARHTKPR
jgi:hypothetical protein